MMAKQQDQTYSREALAEAFRYEQLLGRGIQVQTAAWQRHSGTNSCFAEAFRYKQLLGRDIQV